MRRNVATCAPFGVANVVLSTVSIRFAQNPIICYSPMEHVLLFFSRRHSLILVPLLRARHLRMMVNQQAFQGQRSGRHTDSVDFLQSVCALSSVFAWHYVGFTSCRLMNFSTFRIFVYVSVRVCSCVPVFMSRRCIVVQPDPCIITPLIHAESSVERHQYPSSYIKGTVRYS